MEFSKRMQSTESNSIAAMEEERKKLVAQGRSVINLSVGKPDLPPDDFVMEVMAEACRDPENYKYSLGDLPQLTEAVVDWYKARFGVALQPDQITSCYGSQEGIAHICFPLCDPGDVVLVPDPGYPVFSYGPFLAGARLAGVPLERDKGYLMDFDAIPPELADKARVIIVSYPNNPTTARADAAFYERLVHFAKRHNIIVVHDNAYCELVLNGAPGGSFLQAPGAMDVGIEFNSLSKSYNLSGARMSFVLGNRDIIAQFKRLRSQIDYGPFLAVQKAAQAALRGPQDILDRNRAAYRERRDALCQGLRRAGWPVPDCDSTMFTWFPIPNGFADDEEFTFALMERTGVLVLPGSSFGQRGKNHVRMALVHPAQTLCHAAELIGESGILQGR